MKSHGTRPTELMKLPSQEWIQAHRDLEDEIVHCEKCPGLNIPESTMSASGYGKVPCELMVVGQSLHGYNDQTPDRQIPFVGPLAHCDSGKILYDILEQSGYTYAWGNLFMTNVVKCHPPRNRASLPHEVDNCSLYLWREIEMVKPRMIMTVGTDARQAFDLNRSRKHIEFASWERKVKKFRDIPLNVYYIMIRHPSAIMRYMTPGVRKRYITRCVQVLREVGEKIR